MGGAWAGVATELSLLVGTTVWTALGVAYGWLLWAAAHYGYLPFPGTGVAMRAMSLSLAVHGVATLLVGSVAWAILGYAATIPLGAIFGWSGHPAMPAAPLWIYAVLYLVALPILCLYLGWRTVKWLAARVG